MRQVQHLTEAAGFSLAYNISSGESESARPKAPSRLPYLELLQLIHRKDASASSIAEPSLEQQALASQALTTMDLARLDTPGGTVDAGECETNASAEETLSISEDQSGAGPQETISSPDIGST